MCVLTRGNFNVFMCHSVSQENILIGYFKIIRCKCLDTVN